MERTGELESVSRDVISGKIRISFMLDDIPETSDITGRKLTITAKRTRRNAALTQMLTAGFCAQK